MEKKFNIVYITTNLINGKEYIGDHSTNDINCACSKRYMGSGLGIKNAIKKYGRQNFKRKILEQFETKQEAFDAQEKYIIQYNTLTPNGYNNNKRGGNGITGLSSKEKNLKLSKIHKGKHLTEEHINAIKLYMKTFHYTEETKQKLRKPKKTKDKYAESKIGKRNPMYGISLHQLWVQKYGEEEAKRRQNERTRKRTETNKKIKLNGIT